MTRRLLTALFFIGGVVLAQPSIEVQEVLALCGNYNSQTNTCLDANRTLTTPKKELKRLHITCKYGIDAKEKATVYCLEPERAEN